ncbi:MAG: hypothetical protein OEZ48_10145 [Candidatus Bathyarchaeota archaeon]|nr:hypothetical protein [Candidatus Bathyarchaeota archaeon]MDH5688205.1 hypothetical protein [Candidatus Bathyarchaeota archaeon]
MAREKRIGIIQLIKHSKEYLEHSPKQAAESIRKFREFHKRWEDKVKGLHFYHAIGIEKFDTLAVWEVSDIGDWIAYNEEMMREFGDDYENIETYVGINDRYWEEAMKDSRHFLDLKKELYG